MPADIDERAHVWVAIDVAAEALSLSVRRARELARTEQWRSSQGARRTRPTTQYLWADIVTTYRHRHHLPTPNRSNHMNAAIAALEAELSRAELDLEKVSTDTKDDIDQGQRAAQALSDARQIVAELKAAIATLTPTPQPEEVRS